MGDVPKVLMVDDDPTVLRIARIALEAMGAEVLSAQDVAEARKFFHADVEREIDALLCDVAMPGTNGIDLAREFRKSRPELRVLLMSGRVDESDVKEPRENSFRFIAKPFLPSTLERQMQVVLGERAASA